MVRGSTVTLALAALLPCSMAFSPMASKLPMALRQTTRVSRACGAVMQQKRTAGESAKDYTPRLNVEKFAPMVTGGIVLSQLMAPVQEAAAAGGKFGLLEGKAVALVHPAMFAGLFLFTLYTGYQGLMWRKVREIGEEIKETSDKAKIDELTAKRKELLSGNFRDKHFASSSALLALGVTFSIEGACDTYLRAGKLFPGPHLFAGAGITVLWAVAASLAPAMQKGDNNARNAHIAINTAMLGLFAWQLPTGFDILTKVWTKVPWIPAAPVA
mmetsp:Transcript_43170/g.105606  ORF Transcript_43170/g.105606 Transcript_43170/m.105606 type:complete len:271 (-) Transcript_43170:197-1009(-)